MFFTKHANILCNRIQDAFFEENCFYAHMGPKMHILNTFFLFLGGGGWRRLLYVVLHNYWFFFEPAENVLGFKASELSRTPRVDWNSPLKVIYSSSAAWSFRQLSTVLYYLAYTLHKRFHLYKSLFNSEVGVLRPSVVPSLIILVINY